jgi:hypothetical protein
MKAAKIFFGLLGGVYAVMQAVQLIGALQKGDISGMGTTKLLVCIGGLLLGAALCIGLLMSAFKKPAGAGARYGGRR